MAEEETKETEAATEEAPAKKKGFIPLVGGIVGGIALGATLGLFVLGPRLTAAPASRGSAAPSAQHDTATAKPTDLKKSDPPAIYEIDNLVLNPANSNGTHFLLMSVALEVKDAATLDVVKTRDAELRDAILRMFGSKTDDQLSETSQRDGLRTELIATVDKIFGPGTVKTIYFPQFVLQ